jgi:hypothetical protein
MSFEPKAKRKEAFVQAMFEEPEPMLEQSSDGEGNIQELRGCPHCAPSKFPNCVIPVHEDCGGTRNWRPLPFFEKISQDPIHIAKVPRPRLLTDPQVIAELHDFVLEIRYHRVKKQRLQYRVGAWGL